MVTGLINIKPSELAWAFLAPFVYLICGFGLLLAVIYLMIGVDPTAPVGDYLVDAVDESLPLAGVLIVLWVFYCIIYFWIWGHVRDLQSVVQAPSRAGEILLRRGFFCWPRLVVPVNFVFLFSQVRPCRACLPVWLAVGWQAGHSVQLE